MSGAGKSSEIRLRMCGPPLYQLYMLVALINAIVIVCCMGRPLLCILRFCGLIFGTVPPEGPKNGTVKVLSVLSLCCECNPKMELPGGPF